MVDWGMKITLVTPELSIEDMANLLYAKKQGIADEIDVDALETEGKTPSERLRNVIYAVWANNRWKTKYDIFNEYYQHQMEFIIEQYKAKLPPL